MCFMPIGESWSFLSCREAHGDSQWCYDNYINPRSMKTAVEIRKQLVGYCEKLDLPEVVRTAACSSLEL